MIRYDSHRQRLYVLDRHVHHFWLGLALACHPRYRWLGLAWALTDLCDARDWLPALFRPELAAALPGGVGR